MKEYTYSDFLDTLDQTGQEVLAEINKYIHSHYPEYKPFDIKPTNRSEKEWAIHYRKKPKTGKAICSVFSMDGKLSLRFCFFTSMIHEFLIRQLEFTDKMRKDVLKQAMCSVNKSCRCYGGTTSCQWGQYFWISNRLVKCCPYPWVYFYGLHENDFADIMRLIDLQMAHMVQDAKDIKGNTYAEENAQRCKEVQSITLDEMNLDIDAFQLSDHVKKTSRLDKYVEMYNLVPMGENNGLWFYFSDESVGGRRCGLKEYSHNAIPEGQYAAITMENPFAFSFNRAWNYICKWILDNGKVINGLLLHNGESTACLIKIFMEGSNEFMSVYVPIK